MGSKILLADDEEGLVSVLKNFFEMSGYQVLTAYNGAQAIKQAACMPDLILLDINMPDMDGLTVCERIREHVSCPILFLTAYAETADKIRGFTAGADDYIGKPFDFEELAARVAAHLRREDRKRNQTVLRFFGDMSISYAKHEIWIGEAAVTLSKTEFGIVELLSLNAGQIFDRERIYEAVRGMDGNGSSDTVMEHIRKIRAKFSAYSPHNYIETVWGVGYKWNG